MRAQPRRQMGGGRAFTTSWRPRAVVEVTDIYYLHIALVPLLEQSCRELLYGLGAALNRHHDADIGKPCMTVRGLGVSLASVVGYVALSGVHNPPL